MSLSICVGKKSCTIVWVSIINQRQVPGEIVSSNYEHPHPLQQGMSKFFSSFCFLNFVSQNELATSMGKCRKINHRVEILIFSNYSRSKEEFQIICLFVKESNLYTNRCSYHSRIYFYFVFRLLLQISMTRYKYSSIFKDHLVDFMTIYCSTFHVICAGWVCMQIRVAIWLTRIRHTATKTILLKS